MDTENLFKKSDWIGQGKAWATVPPRVKKIAADFFSIPQALESELLPSPYLPIAKLLEHPFPLQNAAVTASQPAQYFSTTAPDVNDTALMLRIRHLAIPDSKTVNKLIACSRQCWLDGFQSVIYSHLGGVISHFPLWILTYWAAVGEIKHDVWGPWRTSQGWINRQKKISKINPTRAVLAEEATMMLAMLPWGCSKPPGLSDSEPLYTLWRLAGPNWLAGSQMNDMLELLRSKINSDPDLVKNTRVWGTALLPKILQVSVTSILKWISFTLTQPSGIPRSKNRHILDGPRSAMDS
ncbi:hypothetical protein B0H10DRAFT_2120560 [Mycena sp. CBHHK59/15]|nr:hypothetical protein B0H10DRAFT_2120560 [Mycena sp. CBHHK59/15]